MSLSPSTSEARGFLDLPQEIRDEIYSYLVVKPTNTITMLENHNCFQNEVSAAQPAISRVNKQMRLEALPMFYKSNLFRAELSNSLDLETARSWLAAIGDLNARHLRRLAVCGWTKVAFGQAKCRLWIRVVFNLKEGTLDIEGNEVKVDESRNVFKDMEDMKVAFKGMVDAKDGRGFGVQCLGRLMEGFHGLCTEYCTENVKDVDGECRKCET